MCNKGKLLPLHDTLGFSPRRFILYNYSTSSKIEKNLHLEKKFFANENGRYRWWFVAKDLYGNQNEIRKKEFDNYDVHERLKNEFKLDFNFLTWDFYVEINNPEESIKLDTFGMIFSLPILESSVKINEKDPEKLVKEKAGTNLVIKIKNTLNVGDNSIHYHLIIPKETIKSVGKNQLEKFNYKFHIFPLDSYSFDKNIHLIQPEGIILDDVIIKILKIPNPYQLDLGYSGLVNYLPQVEIINNFPSSILYNEVVNITAKASFREEYVEKFNSTEEGYILFSESSKLINPRVKLKIVAPPKYRTVAWLQILVFVFFLIIGVNYMISNRNFIIKDKVDKFLGQTVFDRYKISKHILNYWVRSGIIIFSTLKFFKSLLLDNVYIPYKELGVNYTLLDFGTWFIIALFYTIIFYMLDKNIKNQKRKNKSQFLTTTFLLLFSGSITNVSNKSTTPKP